MRMELPTDAATACIQSIALWTAQARSAESQVAPNGGAANDKPAFGLEAMVILGQEQRIPPDLDAGGAERNIVRVRQMGAVACEIA